jgi:hypothetical protein
MEKHRDYEGWKQWFLSCLFEDICMHNHFKPFKNWVIPVVGGKKFFDQYRKETCRSTETFCSDFRKLCRKYGFDPNSKRDRDRYQNEEGLSVWEPNCGRLPLFLAQESYNFFSFAEREYKRAVIDHKANHKGNRRQRHRLGEGTARCLVYFFVHFKDKPTRSALRNYLIKDLEVEIDHLSKELINKIREMNKGQIPRLQYPVPKYPLIPPSIEKLTIVRGDSTDALWAARWRDDLTKSLISASEGRTVKSLSGRKKKRNELLEDIRRKGNSTLQKFRNP